MSRKLKSISKLSIFLSLLSGCGLSPCPHHVVGMSQQLDGQLHAEQGRYGSSTQMIDKYLTRLNSSDRKSAASTASEIQFLFSKRNMLRGGLSQYEACSHQGKVIDLANHEMVKYYESLENSPQIQSAIKRALAGN